MKTLHAATMIRLFIILILTIYTTSGFYMDEYKKSIDDEFLACKEEMYEHVTTKGLLDKELKSNGHFGNAWAEAKILLKKKNKPNPTLQEKAICAYTTDHIYSHLNDKMRAGKDSYTTDFGLISLHFLITVGIQERNPQATCRITYRRTKVSITIKDKLVRFGSFASSVGNPESINFLGFGKETCFEIYTCHGAPISDLSKVPDEDEILIPPYEEFESEKLNTSPKLSDCKLVYKLTSKGKKSNMNCEYVNQQKNNKITG